MSAKTVFLSLLSALVFLVGAAAVPSTPVMAGATALLTATPTATVTPAPAASSTASPTVSSTPAVSSTDPAMDAWCLPKGAVMTHADLENPTKPANARVMKLAADGTPIVITVDDACFFSFTFSKTAPADLTLEVYDMLNYRWLTSALKPGEKPETVYTALTHGYIVDPPYWSVDYRLRVVDASGAEKWSSKVSFQRGYEPGKCYDGSWPDPVTWYCYVPPDPHPWDSYYKFENPRP